MASISLRVISLRIFFTSAFTVRNKKGLMLYCKTVKLVGVQVLSLVVEQPQTNETFEAIAAADA
jgi:hypothetical protein